MTFGKNNKKKIQSEFLNNGLIVRPILDKKSLNWIRVKLISLIKEELKKMNKKIPNNFDLLNDIHKLISFSELNEFRLKIFRNMNSLPNFEKNYYNIAKPYLDVLGMILYILMYVSIYTCSTVTSFIRSSSFIQFFWYQGK